MTNYEKALAACEFLRRANTVGWPTKVVGLHCRRDARNVGE